MPALVIDRRNQITGPGTHALLVGVSEYTALAPADQPPDPQQWGMRRLQSPALSAFRIYEALAGGGLQLSAPLKTCRLLLSPSAAELQKEGGLAGLNVPDATRDEFQSAVADWRDDANDHNESVTALYFAGHGVQRGPEEAILVFSDVFARQGFPPQNQCALFSSIKNGMAPSQGFEGIAHRQFYFIDACRVVPEALKAVHSSNIPDVFSGLSTVDRRHAPAFFATVDGAVAVGRAAQPSIFCEALLHALHHGADQPVETAQGNEVWPVTAVSLKFAIDRYIERKRYAQDVMLTSVVGDPVLHLLGAPPEIDIDLETVPVLDRCALALFDADGVTKFSQDPWQAAKVTVPVGSYRVNLECQKLKQPYKSKVAWVNQRFPQPWRHNLAAFLA